MSCSSSLHCRLSSFLGKQLTHSSKPLQPSVFHSKQGRKPFSMKLSRKLTDLLFTKRKEEVLQNSKRKRLQPGKVSPSLSVPKHITRPPYVGSRKTPGFGNGPEVHDEKGIECMRASGKLAAQVLQHAGTLVKKKENVPFKTFEYAAPYIG